LVPNYIRKCVSGWSNYSCKVISQKIAERKMDNRGSKSVLDTVKEQRVDGSWDLNKTCLNSLRGTLMDKEICYPIKIPSKLINKFKFYSIRAYYSIPINKLDPFFVTGFSDAESSFIILVLNEPRNKNKWTVKARFSIDLQKKKNILILELIKSYLNNIGYISKLSKDSLQYRVSSIKELTTNIVLHF